jgi:hypothetical protein
MLNYLFFLLIIILTLYLRGKFNRLGLGINQSKKKEIMIDLKLAHHVINQIGLHSQDDLLTSQIKQLFIKNKKVSPDMIQHLAELYQMPICQLYLKIHKIINQPLTC